MRETAIVTTSWDDGTLSDLRVAEFLRSRGLPGTFYTPIVPFRGYPALSPSDLRCLASEDFEIGGHGVAHENLPRLPSRELARAVAHCKQTLQDILGVEVTMFSYPGGRYNGRVTEHLKRAGYRGGRTVCMLATRLDFEPFEMPTSLQAYPHSRTTYVKNTARAGNIGRLYEYAMRLSRDGSWVKLGKKLFDRVARQGGVWHLYGHSWEIEQLGLWDDLGTMLDYVCARDGVVYIPNGKVLGYLPRRTQTLQEIERVSS